MDARPTENSRSRTTPDFDPIARAYRALEYLSFGPMLERCRFHFLAECSQARRVLVLGDGDGRFTARLLAAHPGLHVDAVDLSAAMLQQLQNRVIRIGAEARLRTLHADLRSFIPDASGYDLVVSHFFLDCLTQEEVETMLARLLPHLAPRAAWLISEFAIPPKGWRRVAARALVRFLYFAFDRITHLHIHRLPDYAQALSRSGFFRQQHKEFLGGLLAAELWEQKVP